MKPKIKTTCTKLQLHLLSFCLLCLSGKTRCDGNGPAVIKVEQGSDAVLPCSLSSKEDIESKLFDWKKAAQKDGRQKKVFYYDGGVTYDNGRAGQSEEFKGRVSHFPEELEHGNASIIIRNLMVTDSGDYTCVFPHLQPPQTFHIELVVDCVLKDRSDENIRGACPKPYLRILRPTKDGMLLQCVVRGASPKPKVELKDSSGNKLPAKQLQVPDRGGSHDIILQTTVTKTDYYSCVSTQEEICHQISANTYVPVNEPVVVTVEQGRDALLPCSLSTKENIEQGYFDWNKVAQNNEKQKEVFQYLKGRHSNTGYGSQDGGFKDRVSHFQEELTHGNASIIIRNTKKADSGDYTCVFPESRQTFHIELVVGAAPKPNIRILDQTDNRALLQCEVNGNPQPEVEWRDSAGNKLPAEGLQVSDRGGRFYVTLNTTVTKTDRYRCVATQKNISHQIHDETFVHMTGAASKPNIRTLDETENWRLLQCEVNGNPQPEVEWRDSAGNKLPAEEPQVTERDGRFYVTLNTTVTKTDNYRCVATQKEINHQIYIETFVHITGPTPTKAEEGSNAILPCSLHTKQNIESEMFEWKKDGLKEVFFHGGSHYNSNRPGQSKEFKGRVFHFPHKLKRGDASITIRNAKMADSGIYTCDFPRLQPRQIFHIELDVVERGNSGSGANSSGSTPGWVIAVLCIISFILFVVAVGGVVLAVLVATGRITLKYNKGSPADQNEGSAVPLKSQPSRSEEAPDPET